MFARIGGHGQGMMSSEACRVAGWLAGTLPRGIVGAGVMGGESGCRAGIEVALLAALGGVLGAGIITALVDCRGVGSLSAGIVLPSSDDLAGAAGAVVAGAAGGSDRFVERHPASAMKNKSSTPQRATIVMGRNIVEPSHHVNGANGRWVRVAATISS